MSFINEIIPKTEKNIALRKYLARRIRQMKKITPPSNNRKNYIDYFALGLKEGKYNIP